MIDNVEDRVRSGTGSAKQGPASPLRNGFRPLKRSRTMLVLFAAMLLTGAVAAACGGSATESPWPVEPDNLVTGPEGEEGRSPAHKDRRPDGGVDPDSGKPVGPNVEP